MRHRRTALIKYFLLLTLTVLCSCVSLTAQPGNCSLKPNQIKDAPLLLGFRLGMTPEEAQLRAPLIRLGQPDQFGVIKTTINPNYDSRFAKSDFAEVRTISFDFLDGKLVTLWIGYEETFKLHKLDEFITNISKSLNVSDDWPVKGAGRHLNCDGFSLFASIIARGPSIRVRDEAAQDVIAERREKAVEAAEAEVVGDNRTLTYYSAGCLAKDEIPQTNRTVFKNKEAAESLGYKPAKECQ